MIESSRSKQWRRQKKARMNWNISSNNNGFCRVKSKGGDADKTLQTRQTSRNKNENSSCTSSGKHTKRKAMRLQNTEVIKTRTSNDELQPD